MTGLATLLRAAAPSDARSDGDLLAAFLAQRDEVAFAELVRRHGAVVWGACRRLLPNPADAEDAFQATFLVLVRRAGKLRRHPAVGPWLYKVAALTARNLRRKNARTLARVGSLPAELPAASPDPDLRPDLDAALLDLPEKYRTPLVLCHLQGWSRKDAAAQLGCPEGTLSAWLARGLTKLRHSLPGLDPAKVLAVPAVAVPGSLAAAVVRAAVASRLAFAGVVSSSVSQLAEGVLHMFWVKKATAATLALMGMFALGLGVGVSVRDVPTTMAGAQDKSPAKPDAASAEGSALQDKLKAAEEAFNKARHDVYRLREALELASLQREFALQVDAVIALHHAENRLKACFDEYVALAKLDPDRRADPPADKQPVVVPAGLAMAYNHAYRETLRLRQMVPFAAKRVEDLEEAIRNFDQVRRDLESAKKDLAATRADLAKAEADLVELEKRGARLPVQPAPHVELRVRGPKAAVRFPIAEFDVESKLSWELPAADDQQVRKYLTRVRLDPNAPRLLRVWMDTGATVNDLADALRAVKAAGFTEAWFTGYVPTGGGVAPPLQPGPDGEAKGYERIQDRRVMIEELLKKLPAK